MMRELTAEDLVRVLETVRRECEAVRTGGEIQVEFDSEELVRLVERGIGREEVEEALRCVSRV